MKATTKKRLSKYAIALIFLCLGIHFLSGNYNNHVEANRAKRMDSETTAVVTEVNGYQVIIQYEVGGQIYTSDLGRLSGDMRVGHIITIYYNASSPEDFSSSPREPLFVLIATYFVGAFVLAVGVCLAASQIKFDKKMRHLKERGQKITAVIKEIQIDRTTRIDGVYGRKLVCDVELFGEAGHRRYYSEKFYKDLENIEDGLVDIYIDKENPNIYFMDIESINLQEGKV